MLKPKKRPRPKKGDLTANQKYLKDWDDYQAARMKDKRTPILLPVLVSMSEKGELVRSRMEAPQVAKLAKRLKDDLPHYMFNRKMTDFDPKAIFKDYIDYFKAQDGAQGSRPPTPLDLVVKRPVWNLFYLTPKAWKFSKDKQYSTENDPDDMCRNFEKIATMDGGNALLLSNRRRCAPKGLKFNLHVTITQKVDGRTMKTPIIIDPDTNNDEDAGDFNNW